MTSVPASSRDYDDIAEIERLLRGFELPRPIYGFDLEADDDWAGKPAAYIWLLLDKDVSSSDQMPDLNKAAAQIRTLLLSSEIHRWPYVGFRVRKDENTPFEAG